MENRVLGLCGFSKLRCLQFYSYRPWDAASVRALGQFRQLDSLMVRNLDEAAVSALINFLSKRLIRLSTGEVPQCVERIAKSFTKLRYIYG